MLLSQPAFSIPGQFPPNRLPSRGRHRTLTLQFPAVEARGAKEAVLDGVQAGFPRHAGHARAAWWRPTRSAGGALFGRVYGGAERSGEGASPRGGVGGDLQHRFGWGFSRREKATGRGGRVRRRRAGGQRERGGASALQGPFPCRAALGWERLGLRRGRGRRWEGKAEDGALGVGRSGGERGEEGESREMGVSNGRWHSHTLLPKASLAPQTLTQVSSMTPLFPFCQGEPVLCSSARAQLGLRGGFNCPPLCMQSGQQGGRGVSFFLFLFNKNHPKTEGTGEGREILPPPPPPPYLTVLCCLKHFSSSAAHFRYRSQAWRKTLQTTEHSKVRQGRWRRPAPLTRMLYF